MKKERKGGVLRTEGEVCTFRNDTNVSLRVRRRGCYFGADRENEELEGEKHQRIGKEKVDDA